MSESDETWAATKAALDAFAKDAPLANLKFDDPKAAKRRGMSPKMITARQKGYTNVVGGRRAPKTVEEKLSTDRIDPEALKRIQEDPSECLRQQLSKMLAQENHVNDELYTQTPLDDKAISASNKRIMDIGDSLKALPKQSNETAANQKSLAEVIADTLKDHPEWGNELTPEEEKLFKHQMERAETAFGEGS